MSSTFTKNKNIEKPANGDYVDDWDVPVNNDFDIIDSCLGGNANISVNGLTAGNYNFTESQLQSATITFAGTLSGDLVFQSPNTVSAAFDIQNLCTGGHSISLLVVTSVMPVAIQTTGTARWFTEGLEWYSATDGAAVKSAAVATTSLNVPNTYGGLGTYALGVAATGTFTPGQTTAGSNLNIYASGGGGPTALTGTWQFMGAIASGLAQLWLRTA